MDHIFCLSHFSHHLLGSFARLAYPRKKREGLPTHGTPKVLSLFFRLLLMDFDFFFITAFFPRRFAFLKINEACVLITLTRRIYTVVFCSFLRRGKSSSSAAKENRFSLQSRALVSRFPIIVSIWIWFHKSAVKQYGAFGILSQSVGWRRKLPLYKKEGY